MALHQTWKEGVLIREFDDVARTVSTWRDDGTNKQTRPFTAEENALTDRSASDQVRINNETTIRDRLQLAIDTNNTYLAIGTPTAAQTTAQVKELARQNTALIRMVLRRFDSSS